MKILSVRELKIPEIKVIRFGRFKDHRGYFAEHFRRGDLQSHPDTAFLRGVDFLQSNESHSRAGTLRGLHFQWNPYMGKLVRTLQGHMVDLALDIRKGASTFGRLLAYEMPSQTSDDFNEWIWVPPGFAHGNFFTGETTIEYLCSGEYNPQCEAGISLLAPDIDWSLCKPSLKEQFDRLALHPLITEKDRNGFTLSSWIKDPRSDLFLFPMP